MHVKDWPVSERPREKLLYQGPQSLSNTELVAIFLLTGHKGKSALDLARDILIRFGGLRALMDAPLAEFSTIAGMGPAKIALLKAAIEISRRTLQEKLIRQGSLSSPSQATEFLRAQLRDSPHEIFACLFLDSRHRIICFERLFEGSIDQATVHPRELVRRVLYHNAAAVIFAHNHPSGIAEPSDADRRLTDKLVQVLRILEVRVLDHIVIGDDVTVSLAERGWV